jgi:hypothetical protein
MIDRQSRPASRAGADRALRVDCTLPKEGNGHVSPTLVLHIVYPSLIADSSRRTRLGSNSGVRHVTDPRPIRRRSALAVVVLTVITMAVVAQPANAADDCAKQVIADWYDNGRVDQVYELQCYRDAVDALPVDVRDYSSAKEDILRALQFAQQGATEPTSDDGDDGDDGATGAGGAPAGGSSGSSGGGSGGSDGGPTPTVSAPQIDTAGPSSVPVPLLVLAGLATLLLTLGAAGYLTRRRAVQRGGEPPTPA